MINPDLNDIWEFGEWSPKFQTTAARVFKERPDVDRLKSPVLEVSPGRAGADAFAIYKQPVTVISRNMDDKFFR
ncbi:MAG TPA: hypothetical protein VI583_17565 [Cyclobacteriaceae bacterium]|nr:hypothetical protein [Cyclobacteriaceae bacterium]